MNLEVTYSKIVGDGEGGGLQQGLTVTTLLNPPTAKFTSQGDGHVRTNTQINFLYYALLVMVSQ